MLPSNLHIVHGDILNANDTIICHQCNCVTHNAKGLAEDLFERYPYSNTYSKIRTPGTVSLHGNGTNQRFILNLYSQNSPGKCNVNESAQQRAQWFIQCLNIIANIKGPS